jgi:hypothetical protein
MNDESSPASSPPQQQQPQQQQQHQLLQRGLSVGRTQLFQNCSDSRSKAGLQQPKEQQLATDRAKLLQAKMEQAEPSGFVLRDNTCSMS